MLQQTTVATAGPYFARFVRRFPSVRALASAREEEVLALWSGLGYYHRARNMLKAARIIRSRHSGRIPADIESLRALPGVGPYTAGAILSIGHGLPYPAVDGNVIRVVCRLAGITEDPAKGSTRRMIESIVCDMIPPDDASAFTQGLMDLGATICIPRDPSCRRCPVAASCLALAQGMTATIPARGKTEAPVRASLAAIVVRRGADVLLVRRGGGTLMSGMWEFPMVPEGRATVIAEAARGLAASVSGRVGEVRHTITRHRITISVYEASPARVLRARSGVAGAVDLSELGVCPSIGSGRVASAAGPDPRKRDEVDARHRRGALTKETAPRRRNPVGARGLRPHPSSLVVDDHSGRLPPRSLAAARKPRARGPSQYSDALLATGWEAGEGRWMPLAGLMPAAGDLALTGAARKIARLLMSRMQVRGAGATV
jgi:A/G-specific adenine glycosylase